MEDTEKELLLKRIDTLQAQIAGLQSECVVNADIAATWLFKSNALQLYFGYSSEWLQSHLEEIESANNQTADAYLKLGKLRIDNPSFDQAVKTINDSVSRVADYHRNVVGMLKTAEAFTQTGVNDLFHVINCAVLIYQATLEVETLQKRRQKDELPAEDEEELTNKQIQAELKQRLAMHALYRAMRDFIAQPLFLGMQRDSDLFERRRKASQEGQSPKEAV